MPRKRTSSAPTQRRRRTRLERLWATVLRNPIKAIAFAVAIIAGIPGFMGGWNYVEPMAPAHRAYVRAESDDVKKAEDAKVEALRQAALSAVQRNYAATRDTQLELAEGKRDQAVNDIAKWKIELAKAPTPDSQDLITKQITSLNTILEKLNAQIRTLTSTGR